MRSLFCPALTPAQTQACADILAELAGEAGLCFCTSHGQRQDRGLPPDHQARIDQGKQALVLVPEIALTPQTVSRFGSRFERASQCFTAASLMVNATMSGGASSGEKQR